MRFFETFSYALLLFFGVDAVKSLGSIIGVFHIFDSSDPIAISLSIVKSEREDMFSTFIVLFFLAWIFMALRLAYAQEEKRRRYYIALPLLVVPIVNAFAIYYFIKEIWIGFFNKNKPVYIVILWWIMTLIATAFYIIKNGLLAKLNEGNNFELFLYSHIGQHSFNILAFILLSYIVVSLLNRRADNR